MAMLLIGDEAVAENVLVAEDRNQLADDAHARQDHDVHGRMGIEPEKMLEQHRVAAQLGIEDPMPKTRSATSSISVIPSTGVAST